MNISFKGMQNVGAYFDKNKEKNKRLDRIAIQLNNEGEHQDLDDFREILKDYPSFRRSNFLDMEFKTSLDSRNQDQIKYDVYINSERLRFENKNLPVFAQINNLLKRIVSGNEEIPTTERYLSGKDCHDRFYSQVADRPIKEQFKFINEIHEPDFVKSMANKISKSLTSALDDFCYDRLPQYFDDVKTISGFSYENKDYELKRIYMELNDGDLNRYKYLIDEFPFKDDKNCLTIDLKKEKDSSELKIYLNNYKINPEEDNFDTFRDINNLLKKISATKKYIPFPENYTGRDHMDDMTEGWFQPRYLYKWYNEDEDCREGKGIRIDVAENKADMQQLAQDSIDFIEKAIARRYR